MLASLAVARPAAAHKASLHGLVTMGRIGFVTDPSVLPDNSLREAFAHPGVYAGAVILATWAQLEPRRGVLDVSAIEAGLASIRAYDARYPAARLRAKLRVFGGPDAPGWALALDGGPVMLSEHGVDLRVGHVWSAPYRAAWRALQDRLAARYDADPLVAEVAVSSCASSSAEPFVVPLHGANIAALVQAGYSDAAMEACLAGAAEDYAGWRQVVLDYTFNPWRRIGDGGGGARPAPGFAEGVMGDWRARLGDRGVIANHGLLPQVRPRAEELMAVLQQLGPPIAFQTDGPRVDWDGAVRHGVAMGASEIEVWDSRDAGGVAPVTLDQLRQWRQDLGGDGVKRRGDAGGAP